MGWLGAELGAACSPVPLIRPYHCTISQVGKLGPRPLWPRTLGWLHRQKRGQSQAHLEHGEGAHTRHGPPHHSSFAHHK